MKFLNNYIPNAVPLHEDFFALYLDKKNPTTYLNITQSARALSIPDEEIIQIPTSNWFVTGVEFKRKKQLVNKAEQNLEELLHLDTMDEEGRSDPQLLALKLKAAMYATERLAKDHYSPRTEHKEDVTVNIFRTLDQINKGVFQEGKPIEIAYNPINNE